MDVSDLLAITLKEKLKIKGHTKKIEDKKNCTIVKFTGKFNFFPFKTQEKS
jgi:hypothetical protein